MFDNFHLARSVFIIPPVIVALYFCINTVKSIQLKSSTDSVQKSYSNLNLAGKLGILFMATMPIVVAVGDYQIINNGLINVSFILIFISYYILLFLRARNEYNLLKVSVKNEKITDLGLTPRELEVAGAMLKGENYQDLASIMNIEYKTISKHASNIFRKAGCNGREEFIRKYLID